MGNPSITGLDRWKPWRRKIPYGRIGFGYQVDPEDAFNIIPKEDEIAVLEQAFDYIDAGSSWRETTEWVTQKLLRTMVHQTLSNLYNKHRKPYLNRKTLRRNGRVQTKEEASLRGAKLSAKKAQQKVDAIQKKRELGQLLPEDFDTPPVPPAWAGGSPVLKDPSLFQQNPKAASPDRVNFVFRPNEGPQTQFLSASEEEVLYGGAAGGGKSFAMLADPMRYFDNPDFVGLLLRRTNDELRELKWESQKLYPQIWPDAKWKEKDSMWVFPSGAKFWITYLDREEDVMRYQGQAFSWIGMDELTQYASPFAYTYLKSRLRITNPELKKAMGGGTGYMRATTNPGGPGHHWVKKMFIDPEIAGKAFWATDIESGEVMTWPSDHEDQSKAGKPLFKRKFIPALLKDNPYLYADGAYERSLQGLPENERRKLLEGDWSIVEGAAFAEFTPKYHVCKPFDIPPTWRRFRAADYGYSSPACVLWFAIDPSFDTLYVYRELYKKGMTGTAMANNVLSMESSEAISYGILDSSVWHERGIFGPTVAEEMIALGCKWRPSDRGKGSRTAGKNRLHELLRVNEDALGNKRPSIIFFDTCRQLIADIPSIPVSPDGKEDIDDRYTSDHTYDALRYGIMSRPRATSHLDWGTRTHHKYTPSDPTFGY